VLHALVDALMGAIAGPDIGQLFPDDDPAHDGADSARFVEAAMARVRASGHVVGNLDVTIVCQRPRIAPRKPRIVERLAALCGVGADRVSIKGKTGEGVDAVGAGEAIEAHVVVLLLRVG